MAMQVPKYEREQVAGVARPVGVEAAQTGAVRMAGGLDADVNDLRWGLFVLPSALSAIIADEYNSLNDRVMAEGNATILLNRILREALGSAGRRDGSPDRDQAPNPAVTPSLEASHDART